MTASTRSGTKKQQRSDVVRPKPESPPEREVHPVEIQWYSEYYQHRAESVLELSDEHWTRWQDR